MTVIAEIDVTKPAGVKVLRDLEKHRVVKLTYESPETSGVQWHDFEDVLEASMQKMSGFYGVNIRPLVAKYSSHYRV